MIKGRAGFSLLELIISISLASLVLVAIVSMAASAVRFQMDGVRKGTVTGWSLISFLKLTKEIEGANVLVVPTTGTPNSNILMACTNWSRLMAASPGDRLDTTQPVEVVYYCLNTGAKVIWRYYSNALGTCPLNAAAITACDGSEGGFTEKMQMAWNVELQSPYTTMFTRDNTIGGVRLHYVVGEQTSTEKHKQPIFTAFDMGLVMQKQFSNTAD